MTCPAFCDGCGGNLGHAANDDILCSKCHLVHLRLQFPEWNITWEYGMFRAQHDNFAASWEGEEDGFIGDGWSAEARTAAGLIMVIEDIEEEKDHTSIAAVASIPPLEEYLRLAAFVRERRARGD